MNKFSWLFVDVDGVMTNGTKSYDYDHNVISKNYNDKDFTALALFKKKGVRVVLISGDKKINEGMAKSRGLEAHFTGWLLVDKPAEKNEKVAIMEMLGADLADSAYVGDDYFDIEIFKSVGHSYCPSDAPGYVKKNCSHTLSTPGGAGVIADLFNEIYGDNFD
jgi:3-deoxy-D-manno-octulosonate 8-phosphate phosphatase (KDO 8-P phosphatase)